MRILAASPVAKVIDSQSRHEESAAVQGEMQVLEAISQIFVLSEHLHVILFPAIAPAIDVHRIH